MTKDLTLHDVWRLLGESIDSCNRIQTHALSGDRPLTLSSGIATKINEAGEALKAAQRLIEKWWVNDCFDDLGKEGTQTMRQRVINDEVDTMHVAEEECKRLVVEGERYYAIAQAARRLAFQRLCLMQPHTSELARETYHAEIWGQWPQDITKEEQT